MSDKIEVEWLGVVKSIATKEVSVMACSKKEAQEKLRMGEGEGIDVTYVMFSGGRILRRMER